METSVSPMSPDQNSLICICKMAVRECELLAIDLPQRSCDQGWAKL